MSDDLFSAAAAQRLQRHQPLAARLRPRSLDDIVGQDELLAPGRPFRTLVEQDRLGSVLLWGPPGVGKTTLAQALAAHTDKAFVELSAVNATVKDVREAIAGARARLGERGRGTILFLDEIHRFNKAQQDALLPSVEEGLIVLVGATTENPYFEVNGPLRSRSTLFRLQPLGIVALDTLVRRGLEAEGAVAGADSVALLVDRCGGDGRQALTALEVAVALAADRSIPPEVLVGDVEAALGTNALRYGVQEHYDVISAFIKAMRAGDSDDAVRWLALMLEAGEDARFIARRMVIFASEDIGTADPLALVVADAAARAVDFVGLPEAAHNLAHAALHLSAAPKSRAVVDRLHAARDDVRSGPYRAVPPRPHH